MGRRPGDNRVGLIAGAKKNPPLNFRKTVSQYNDLEESVIVASARLDVLNEDENVLVVHENHLQGRDKSEYIGLPTCKHTQWAVSKRLRCKP